MPNKYEYAEGMTAEDKRKYRRQARAAAAKGEALPTPVAGLATNGTAEGAAKPARGRKASAAKAQAGGVVVEAPEPIEEEEEEALEAEDEPELLRLFATKGVLHNPRLMVGHGFQVKGFGKQSEAIKEAKIDVLYNKFFARWGHAPTQIRILPGRVVILGLAEYSG